MDGSAGLRVPRTSGDELGNRWSPRPEGTSMTGCPRCVSSPRPGETGPGRDGAGRDGAGEAGEAWPGRRRGQVSSVRRGAACARGSGAARRVVAPRVCSAAGRARGAGIRALPGASREPVGRHRSPSRPSGRCVATLRGECPMQGSRRWDIVATRGSVTPQPRIFCAKFGRGLCAGAPQAACAGGDADHWGQIGAGQTAVPAPAASPGRPLGADPGGSPPSLPIRSSDFTMDTALPTG